MLGRGLGRTGSGISRRGVAGPGPGGTTTFTQGPRARTYVADGHKSLDLQTVVDDRDAVGHQVTRGLVHSFDALWRKVSRRAANLSACMVLYYY